MKRILVDTGAWYAYLDEDDPDHQRVAPVLEENLPVLMTSDYIADETLTLLRYRAGREAAVKFGELLFSGQLCQLEHISRNDQRKAWQLFLKYHDHCFSYTDCTSFVLMERLELEVAIALDTDFRSYGLHCLPY
jgi:hypothetical protein